MKKSVAFAAVVFALLLSGLAMADHHMTTTREAFKEFCNAWRGRWVGDVTWVADWPGLGKRGDKVTGYLDAKTIEDGNALVLKFYGGNGSGTGVFAYDASAKQIKSLVVFSGGYVGTSVLYKRDGKWREAISASLPDGKKSKANSTFTYSDNGNTLTVTGSGTIGNEKQNDQHDVWRRVSNSSK